MALHGHNFSRYGPCSIVAVQHHGLTQALGGKPSSGANVKRALLTLIAFLVTAPVIGVITFFAVIFLAGPHGGVLPEWAEPIVLVLGWSSVILLPVLIARKVWLRSSPAQVK